MKGILRQAFDVIFVWEMRDAEETQQWVKTGLVWNKLITTFHTNSAVDTILRLKEEWVTNNAISNGVKEITAQRLVQKVCSHCSIDDPEHEKNIKRFSKIFNRSRLYFLSEMESMLAHLTLSEISDIDTLELHIHDNLVFLSHDDIKDMIELLEENSSKYQKLKTKEERAEFLLRLYDNFPSVELRKWIQAEIDNACIKVANPEWCKHCNKWYTRERTMIVEGLTIDKPIKRFIQDPESKLVDLEKFLLNKGFLNMKMYGYILIMQGITTLEKVNEVIDD